MEREYTYKLKTLVEGQKLNVVYPSTDYEKVLIKTGDIHRPGLQLAGFYDYFDPSRVQLIGRMETAFLRNSHRRSGREKIDVFMSQNVPVSLLSATAPRCSRIRRRKRPKVRRFAFFNGQNTSAVRATFTAS
jgi:HPr kinase/phosphorylase